MTRDDGRNEFLMRHGNTKHAGPEEHSFGTQINKTPENTTTKYMDWNAASTNAVLPYVTWHWKDHHSAVFQQLEDNFLVYPDFKIKHCLHSRTQKKTAFRTYCEISKQPIKQNTKHPFHIKRAWSMKFVCRENIDRFLIRCMILSRWLISNKRSVYPSWHEEKKYAIGQ